MYTLTTAICRNSLLVFYKVCKNTTQTFSKSRHSRVYIYLVSSMVNEVYLIQTGEMTKEEATERSFEE